MLIANHNPALELLSPQTHTWSEVAFPNTFDMENFDCERNNVLELLLPLTHPVSRGSIPQRASNWEHYTRILKHCVGATIVSDTFRDQR